MQGTKFSKHIDTEFSRAVNQRVNVYFKENGISRNANQFMILKTLLLFGLYVLTYCMIIMGGITNLPLLFLLWALLGFGQSFIGMSIMHDTVHGAYTKNKLAKFLLGIPIIAIGVEPRIWRIEHNIMHHTYTNVEGIDQDINPRYLFRFSEHQPKRWYHRYQYIYATFFYGFLIIEWLTIKDLLKALKYYRMGFFKTRTETALLTLSIIFKKLIFYFLFLYIPLQLLPFPAIIVFSMFLTMLVVAGIVMTIIFQLAHVVPKCEVESNSAELVNKNWHIHQMLTTSDFAHQNKIISYLIGGLNYQIEHHLFPNVCHVHYPAISGIVKETAKEFDVPYHVEDTFTHAVKEHYRLLKHLGVNEKIVR
jgi:linoleoyl-CoA desaturase